VSLSVYAAQAIKVNRYLKAALEPLLLLGLEFLHPLDESLLGSLHVGGHAGHQNYVRLRIGGRHADVDVILVHHLAHTVPLLSDDVPEKRKLFESNVADLGCLSLLDPGWEKIRNKQKNKLKIASCLT
jgi:hypothetical protein